MKFYPGSMVAKPATALVVLRMQRKHPYFVIYTYSGWALGMTYLF